MRKISIRWFIAVLSVTVLSIILPFVGGCSRSTEVTLESYVAPITGTDKLNPNITYVANAFLLDNERGLFLINAHMVAGVKDFMIRFLNKWYKVELREEWINWETDLAIIKIDTEKYKLQILTKPPLLLDNFCIGSAVTVRGYVLEKAADANEYVFKLYSVNSRIEGTDSNWYSILDKMQFLLDGEPKEKLYLLYKHYILLVEDVPEDFCSGLSGSPVITESGEVMGVLSAAYENSAVPEARAMIVPAFEIKNLLEKVK